ncbi:CDP-alcohol phosphatidyltransferase family protein [Acidiferrobacter sp.]|uniref:CDP-alcohol phosphatidyltransferase family protein n=1 Tax=Acidiferrobacter sp. TaxID=1872107 RepID=UPI0026197F11|nr:CDP-alcohol phosphatidyltransferase family protein [Acidiferrobacter sp.]
MKRLQYLPNMITLMRVAFVPLLILVLKDHHYLKALAVFLVAGISDGLDGYIAKRFGFVSQLGAILDPLADKILLVSAYIMLALLALVPFWLVLVVTFRDVVIVGGYLVYTSLYGPVSMRPSRVSKFNTFTQILLVVFVLTERAFAFPAAHIQAALVFMVLVTTIASGGHYLWTWGIVREIDAGRAGKD